jgi:hypothetical protein
MSKVQGPKSEYEKKPLLRASLDLGLWTLDLGLLSR